MAGQTSAGRNLLLYLGNGGDPETFAVLCAAQSNGMTINNETVDTTDKCGTGWRELAEGGIKSMTLSVSGILRRDVSSQELAEKAFAGSIDNYQFKDNDSGDIIEGPFQITSYERTGEHNGRVTFTATLESAGEVEFTFTPIAS